MSVSERQSSFLDDLDPPHRAPATRPGSGLHPTWSLVCAVLVACSTGANGSVSSPGGASGSGGVPNMPGSEAGGAAGSAGSSAGASGTVNAGLAGNGGTPITSMGGGTEIGGVGGSDAGESGNGGRAGLGGAAGQGGGANGGASCTAAPGTVKGVLTDPVTAADISPPNPPGITFKDTDGALVNAHDGGIIRVCDTYYLHGEYFLSTTTDNNFNGFSMYSSKDLTTWKNEGLVLPQQPSGQLGPNRKAERPHIIRCPSSGEFVLYAHSDDVTYQADKEIVHATSPTVNGHYAFKGSLLNSSGAIAAHNDMSAFVDGDQVYVVTESGWVYTIASDCHSWVSAKQYSAVNGTVGGGEAPTVFKAGSTYYWIASDKTGWRANDNFYATAPAMTGPWTAQGYLAPQGKLTWMSQTTWVQPIQGSAGTVYLFWGDHWDGTQDTTAPGKHNYLTTYVFQPLVFKGTAISLPTYQAKWQLDMGAGTWSN